MIKFRAWFPKSTPNSNGDYMIYSAGVCSKSPRKERLLSSKDDMSPSRFWANVLGFTSPVTVMQFTGAHDKNGREVYDQDIIDDGSGALMLVYWSDEHFGFYKRPLEDDHDSNRSGIQYMRFWEVVGNTHTTKDGVANLEVDLGNNAYEMTVALETAVLSGDKHAVEFLVNELNERPQWIERGALNMNGRLVELEAPKRVFNYLAACAGEYLAK